MNGAPALTLLLAAGAAQAGPADVLLAELSAEFREPQSRCESVAARFAQIPLELSLYREELAAVVVSVDGVTVGETSNGAVLRVDFDTRLWGPATATVTFDAGLAARDRLRPGRRVEIGFRDRAGRTHPLACGHAALVREDTTAQRIDLVALMPRAGGEGAASADYANMNCTDVMQGLAQSAGLGFEATVSSSQPVLPLIQRRQESEWTFLRRLGRQCGLDVALKSGGTLRVANRAVPLPAAAARRSWSSMTWVDVAAQIAAAGGRTTEAQLTSSHATQSFTQTQADDDFLARIAADARASAWYQPGKLRLAEDGAWLPNPAARYVADAQMTPTDFAKTVAGRQQLVLHPAATSSGTVLVRQRGSTDAEALLRVLGENRLRLVTKDGALVVAAAVAPGEVTDLLLQRVTITGSTTLARSFTRHYGGVRAQLLDPERVAGVQVTLGLGRSAPQARPASLPLADLGVIARELEAALARLAAPGASPETRFLQRGAQNYRPTLLHLYRLRPDGATALQAIGR